MNKAPAHAPGTVGVVDWSSDPAIRASRARTALDERGFVVLKGFADEARLDAYRRDFDGDAHKMTRSSGSKYSLKYQDIETHGIVRQLRSDELVDFVNAVNAFGNPIASGPLTAADVEVGYSIISGSADFIGFHFDHLNLMNIIVPIMLPPQDSYLWANPNTLGRPGSLMSRLGLRIVPRLMRTALGRFIPLYRYRYELGDVIVFYGHRTLHGVFPSEMDGMRVITSANYRWPELARSRD